MRLSVSKDAFDLETSWNNLTRGGTALPTELDRHKKSSDDIVARVLGGCAGPRLLLRLQNAARERHGVSVQIFGVCNSSFSLLR